MNRYVIRDLKDHGDHFLLLKIEAGGLFSYQVSHFKSYAFTTRHRAFFIFPNSPISAALYGQCCVVANYDLFSLIHPLAGQIICSDLSDYWRGLSGAILGGHLDLILIMMIKAHSYEHIYLSGKGLRLAAMLNHRHILEYLIARYNPNRWFGEWKISWDNGLTGACLGHRQDLIQFFIQKGASWCSNCDTTAQDHP